MWFDIENAKDIVTPAVLIYPDRIDQNVARLVAMVDSVDELCPHVKTHKTTEVLERFTRVGICQFKCATVSELEMVASHQQTTFALLAMQPVGPNIDGLTTVASMYPKCTVATVVDNIQSLEAVAASAIRQQVTIEILLDLNNGMNRTGIRPGDKAYELYNCIADHDSLAVGGLHVYDGHIHDSDFETRKANVEAAMQGVLALRQRLLDSGLSVPRLITGGTPSFPVHRSHRDRICSPGTPALWDAGYASNYPDLEFVPAAVLLTRVVSVIEPGVVCLDLGYKSVASEMQPPRVVFLNADVTEQLSHSEEHLVVKTDKALEVGDVLYALPWHICPTVARHSHLGVVKNGLVVDQLEVTARDRI